MNRDGINNLCDALISLVRIMERLRAPDGCPWDAKQTEETIKIYLLEEAYEVLDAIENKDPKGTCEELGDLLFMIIFLSQIARERNQFTLLNVLKGIKDKMIRRHPHVFGDKKVRDAGEVSENWARIKMEEKKQSLVGILDKIPPSLPALLRAHRLSQRAAQFGFDWADKKEIWNKVREEFSELQDAIEDGDKNKVKEEIGDLIFSLVNLSRHWGLNAEDVLRGANKKFVARFNRMVNKLKEKGIDIREASLDKMDEAWEQIKEDD